MPRQVDVGDLEQLGIGRPMGLVVPPGVQQAGNQAAPQGILFPAARMIDPDRRPGFLGVERLGELLGDEAQRHGLVEAQAGQRAPDLVLHPLAGPARAAGQGDGPILGDLLVAVDPRDLLDQVDLPLEVAPPARGHEPGCLGRAGLVLEPEREEDAEDLAPVDRDPEDAGDLAQPQGDRPAGRPRRADVDHARVERPAGRRQDQLRAAAARPLGHLGVERPFEPVARRAEQPQRPRRPPDRHRVELGGLDQDVGRRVADLGLRPAHHAREADGPLGVGDREHVGGQLVRLVVDRDKLLALPAPAARRAACRPACSGHRRGAAGRTRT